MASERAKARGRPSKGVQQASSVAFCSNSAALSFSAFYPEVQFAEKADGCPEKAQNPPSGNFGRGPAPPPPQEIWDLEPYHRFYDDAGNITVSEAVSAGRRPLAVFGTDETPPVLETREALMANDGEDEVVSERDGLSGAGEGRVVVVVGGKGEQDGQSSVDRGG